MARETKAQRMARWFSLEQEHFIQEQELSKSYHKRLMTALGEATKERWGIHVVDSKFCVYVEGITFELGLDWNWKNDYTLSDLRFQVDVAQNARAEEQRKADLRNNALAKLTQEERKLLNL
jgi:hypothetical protein